ESAEKPIVPVVPVVPVEPVLPDAPVNPPANVDPALDAAPGSQEDPAAAASSQNQRSGSATAGKVLPAKVTKTGDESKLELWALLLGMSTMAMVAAGALYRKSKKN
ncbi:MAG: hypothetical protein RR661_03650, partial [Anaerovoracaceae bacterium]